MIDGLARVARNALGHDQPVTVVRVAFHAQETNGLGFCELTGFAEIEHGLWFFEMSAKDVLERLPVATSCRLSPALRRPEAAQMPVVDPCLGEVGGERRV
jgi:hypothetical protein